MDEPDIAVENLLIENLGRVDKRDTNIDDIKDGPRSNITAKDLAAKDLGKVDTKDRGREDAKKNIILGITAENQGIVDIGDRGKKDVKKGARPGIAVEDLAIKDSEKVDVKHSDREAIEENVRSDIVAEDLIVEDPIAKDPNRIDVEDGSRKDIEENVRPDTITENLVAEELVAEDLAVVVNKNLTKQVAIAFSLLSFWSVFILFFSSSKLDICSYFKSSSLVSVITFIK